MNILYLEDHNFYGDEMYKSICKISSIYKVDYATSYSQAKELMKNKKYDISLLDVILQNGKTGIHFAEEFTKQLGKILFITGCNDELTLKALQHYTYIPKDTQSLSFVKEFLNK